MLAATQRNGADRRAGVDTEPGGLAVDEGADEEMILARTNEGQGFKLRRWLSSGRLRSRRRGNLGRANQSHEQDRQDG